MQIFQRFVVGVGVALVLGGCASQTESTGIIEIGKDTYMASKLGGAYDWSGGKVKAELYKDAGAFCGKKGLKVIPIDSTSQDASAYKYASAEIQFRCG